MKLRLIFITALLLAGLTGAQDMTVEPVSYVRFQWDKQDNVGGYLFESRPLSNDVVNPWKIQSTENNSIMAIVQSEPHEYRVRAVHPSYPESTSVPSVTLVYPPVTEPGEPGNPRVPNIVRLLGVASDGSIWEQNPETQAWEKLF